jgi:peptide deformylase
MSINTTHLSIVTYPAAVLRTRAADVPASGADIPAIAARMIELMRQAEGIGLAAPQVGLSIRLFIADVPPDDEAEPPRSLADDPATCTSGPVVYINPVISSPGRATGPFAEGCLSLPDIRGEVIRPMEVTITYTTLDGSRVSQRGGGLLARCWQHEMDHLDGVLIIDRMTQMGRMKNRAAIKRLEGR